MLLLVVLLTAVATFIQIRNLDAFDRGTCSFTKHEDSPEVYFINLDIRRDRRMNMYETLSRMKLDFHRIRAMEFDDIYIPEDIINTWQSDACIFETEWEPNSLIHSNSSDEININRKFSNAGVTRPIYVSSLCAKPVFMPEIACTASHLMAIHRACHSTTSSSKYAIIMEDDLFVPMDINWDRLIASAPKDFGILQLFSQHTKFSAEDWADYKKNPKELWSSDPLWCMGMYLINKELLKPIVTQLLQEHQHWWQYKLIAPGQLRDRPGSGSHCNPKECCDSDGKHTGKLPCVNALIAADWYLFQLGVPSYTLRVPISFLGSEAKISNIQSQSMVRTDPSAQSKHYMMEMFSANHEVPLPPFAKRACKDDLVLTPLATAINTGTAADTAKTAAAAAGGTAPTVSVVQNVIN